MTPEERDEWEGNKVTVKHRGKRVETKNNYENERARMVVQFTQDDNGEPIFMPGDVKWLGEKTSIVAVDRIYDVIMRLSAVTASDEDRHEKNSSAAAGDES